MEGVNDTARAWIAKRFFARGVGGVLMEPMKTGCVVALAVALACGAAVAAEGDGPPRGNPYDVIGKIFQPFWGVLLAESTGANRAAALTLEMSEASGRLPAEMRGAVLKAAVEFPDKVRLEAPVMGETFIVCRNGNKVWAVPGKKAEFLISQFKVKPKTGLNLNTPIFLPITPAQAIFLPALFSVKRADVAEVEELGGEQYRVITAGLMPELARATGAEDFESRAWVGKGNSLRRVEVQREDFKAVVDLREVAFSKTLPASTWDPPQDATDVFHTTPEMLEGLLYIVMNSLKTGEGDAPWLSAK
jgi:hypothetical protein